MPASGGHEGPSRQAHPPHEDGDAEQASRDSIADLDPDAAAARIAALWREPSAVDAFDVPLDPHTFGPNLLEPDLPEPDLARELARYDTPRPVTGSFERVEADDVPTRGGGRHGSGDEPDDRAEHGVDRDARTGGPPAPDVEPTPVDGRIRRARHSRSGSDDDEPGVLADQDVRFGNGSPTAWRTDLDSYVSPVDLGAPPVVPTPPAHPEPTGDPGAVAAAREEPPTGPVAVGGTVGPGERTPPAGTGRPDRGPDTGDAVDSQLSDRERDLLARLHAELASRERLEGGEPDPFAAGTDGATDRAEGRRHGQVPSSRRPSPSPRPPGPAEPAPTNGHAHGPTNGHHHGPTNGHAHGLDEPSHGQVNGHGPRRGRGPRNGHGLSGDADPGDDDR